jgi:hypothetical protein
MEFRVQIDAPGRAKQIEQTNYEKTSEDWEPSDIDLIVGKLLWFVTGPQVNTSSYTRYVVREANRMTVKVDLPNGTSVSTSPLKISRHFPDGESEWERRSVNT